MCHVSGGAPEEEKEIGGSADGGKGRPVGDGHSSRNRADLQYGKGSTALYPGEFETYYTSCLSMWRICKFKYICVLKTALVNVRNLKH